MSDYIDTQGFRANVGIILISDSGKVFLGSRCDGRGWQFPQGGVRRNESAEAALFRELNEEVGLEPHDVDVVASTRRWLRYRLPRRFVRRRSRPLCIGQKQRWFLLRLLGDEDRVRFDVTSRPEFDAWQWVDYWSPVREVIYFKRRVYVKALEELGEVAFPQGLPPRPDWWSEEFSESAGSRRTSGQRRGRERRAGEAAGAEKS